MTFAVALVRPAFPVLGKLQRERFRLPLNVFRLGYHLIGHGAEYVAIPDAIESHDRVSGLAALCHRAGFAIGREIDCQRSPGTCFRLACELCPCKLEQPLQSGADWADKSAT